MNQQLMLHACITNHECVKISTVDFLIDSLDYLLYSLKWIVDFWEAKSWRFVLKLDFMKGIITTKGLGGQLSALAVLILTSINGQLKSWFKGKTGHRTEAPKKLPVIQATLYVKLENWNSSRREFNAFSSPCFLIQLFTSNL